LIHRAHVYDKKCLIDTTGEALKQVLEAKPMGIHLNEHESQQVTGTSDIGQIMERLSEHTNLQIITQGAKGLFLGTSGDIFHAKVKLNQVLTTVGSGDCLVAGIALAICKGYDNLDKVKLGVAFGAANCLRKELGMLYKKDIDLLLPQIRVNKPAANYD